MPGVPPPVWVVRAFLKKGGFELTDDFDFCRLFVMVPEVRNSSGIVLRCVIAGPGKVSLPVARPLKQMLRRMGSESVERRGGVSV